MSKANVLVIDDDTVILDMIKTIASDNMKIKCVSSLSAAKKALSSKYDLIISDHYLSSSETAEDLVEFLDEKVIKTPLALMTGKSKGDIPAKVKKRSVKIFQKPIPIATLAKWVKTKLKH